LSGFWLGKEVEDNPAEMQEPQPENQALAHCYLEESNGNLKFLADRNAYKIPYSRGI
jgi:hypothetical protein